MNKLFYQTTLFGSERLMAIIGRVLYMELGATVVLGALRLGGVL